MAYTAGGHLSDDLNAIAHWADALLSKLEPAQRRAVNMKVAIDLRRSQAKRIASQKAPDGTPYAARKKRKEIRTKSGRIKRQKAAMFSNLRKAKYLKIQNTADQLSIGYFGWVAKVAGIHHRGEIGRIAKGSAVHRYAARPLLGFSDDDRSQIRDSLLKHLSAI